MIFQFSPWCRANKLATKSHLQFRASSAKIHKGQTIWSLCMILFLNIIHTWDLRHLNKYHLYCPTKFGTNYGTLKMQRKKGKQQLYQEASMWHSGLCCPLEDPHPVSECLGSSYSCPASDSPARAHPVRQWWLKYFCFWHPCWRPR